MMKGSARVYLLESYEGQAFLVDEDVALQSPVVRRQGEEAGVVILMEGADTKSLRKVIEWCKMHTPEKKATVPPDEMRKWEDDYIDPCRVPFCLVHAVCYMEMGELAEQQDRGCGNSHCREGPGGNGETGSRWNKGRKFVRREAG